MKLGSFVQSAIVAGVVLAFAASAQEFDGFTLTLLSIQVVPQKQIPRHDKFWDEGVITSPLVRVDFSTSIDLRSLARRGEYNIDNITSLCVPPVIDRSRKLSGFPGVYDSTGPIDEFRQELPATPRRSAVPPFAYHVYFDVRQSGIHGFYDYDLVRAPSDICIAVNGTTEHEFGSNRHFASRTLVIQKAQLLKAISDAGIR
jgi:hypothetical protein